MDTQITFFFIVSSLIISFYFLFNKKTKHLKALNLPPGPPKLPLIGNLHQIVGGLPHDVFRKLAEQYGPIMHLQLGQTSTIIVSSPLLAKEVFKTNDLALANRPKTLFAEIILYGRSDVAFGPYSDYWRQMKKIITTELLSAKKVRSFSTIRKQEVDNLLEFIQSACGFYLADMFPEFEFLSVISGMKSKLTKFHNILDAIFDEILHERKIRRDKHGSLENDVLDALLDIKEKGGLQFPITSNNIKAIILNMFAGGTNTSVIAIEWAMTEMMRNPSVLEKAQIEVRKTFEGKKTIEEIDLQDLTYLKYVIKETLRLHPPLPLIPRECREQCQIGGYDIPIKARVFVNAFAWLRNPENWHDAENFKPERFEDTSIDFLGTNYEFVLFGAGRRICPGINFGLASIELVLSHLLYHFKWKLPAGLNPKDIDMKAEDGMTLVKAVPLKLIPTPYSPT